MKPPLKKLLNAETPQNHRVFSCKELTLAKTYDLYFLQVSQLTPKSMAISIQ